MRVEFNTTTYEFAHGRKPRGDGMWAFFFNGESNAANSFWHSGTYAAAKEAAKQEAAKRFPKKAAVTAKVGS